MHVVPLIQVALYVLSQNVNGFIIWLLDLNSQMKLLTQCVHLCVCVFCNQNCCHSNIYCAYCIHVINHLHMMLSRSRDFYHTCYCLSGLSVCQHFPTGDNDMNSDDEDSVILVMLSL